MGSRVVSSLLVTALAACGPEITDLPPLVELEPLELLPVCGQPSPFRLLDLDPDQALIDRGSAIHRFQDRLYFLVGRSSHSEGGVQLDPYWLGMEPALYSTGPCGESPRLLATDIWSVFEHPRWPGLLLGWSDGDVVVLDPQGVTEPRVLIEDAPPTLSWTEHGMFDVDDERGALLLRPYPASPDDVEPEPTVVVEPFSRESSWAYRGDELLFVADGAVQRLDLRDGSRSVELEVDGEIERIDLVGDGRFIVWEPPADAARVRSVAIHDRVLGVGAWLGDTDDYLYGYDRGDHLVLAPLDLPEPSHRLVLLPSLEIIDVPPALFLGERIDDARWVAWSHPDRWLVYDRTTNAARALFDGAGETWYYDDRIEVLVPRGYASGFARQGPVYAAWLDGRGHERIVDQATPGLHRLADGRIVTPLDLYDQWRGTLALTGLDGVTRWALDTDVLAWFGQYQAVAGFEDDVVVYGVSDGDRSGVWLARLPAAE